MKRKMIQSFPSQKFFFFRYTDPMHVDYSDINLAHTRMIEICQEVNFQKSMDDNAKGMMISFSFLISF